MRPDSRMPDEMRSVHITPDYNRYAEGSVLVEFGETKLICTATVENKVPPFLEGQGKGWITAEYAMLPRATHTRSGRNPGGRGQEIQRLIGRALRTAIDVKNLGPRQITVDCDVIQADGGTRTAAITGGWVALALAVRRLVRKEKLSKDPMRRAVCAVSSGIVAGEPRLDWPTPKIPPPTWTSISCSPTAATSSRSRALPRASRFRKPTTTAWWRWRRRGQSNCSPCRSRR